MRIGILSYHFPPEPAFIPGSLAEELVARGHDVRVLTGFPDHPGGRIYPGWRQRWHHQTTSERLTVRRVPRYASHDGSPARRAASHLSFAGGAALVAPRYLADVDALYVHHPRDALFAAAGLLRLFRRIPTVLHLQDPWPGPEEPEPWGPAGRLLYGGLGTAMRRVCQAASGIAVSAPSMREAVLAHGVDPAKVRLVLNWTDERIFHPTGPTRSGRQRIGHRGRCLVMQAGTGGLPVRVETAVRAASAVTGKLDLVLVGPESEEGRVRRTVERLGAPNVRFLVWRSSAGTAELYGAADYQLIVQPDLPVLRGTVPAELQAALSCASPVVVSAAGDTVDLVEQARAGLSCPPEDWSALADRFWLAATIPPDARGEMGHRARQSYLRRMCMRVGVTQIERMLAGAVERARPTGPRPAASSHR